MNKGAQSGVSIAAAMIFFAGPLPAADDGAIAKDLTSVIALLGLPCGKVVGVIKKGDNDHVASCQDGNRYRVFLNADGRVIAQKQ